MLLVIVPVAVCGFAALVLLASAAVAGNNEPEVPLTLDGAIYTFNERKSS